MRYLSQSFLLESVSKHKYHFASERMLNLCKALDSLTHDAGESIERMRNLLRVWGIHEGYIAIFCSIRYLRSKLDIAHISYSQLSAQAYEAIQGFLPVAEKCMQALIVVAVKQSENVPSTFTPHENNGEEPDVIKKLAEHKGVKFDRSLSIFSIVSEQL